jgi:two-component system NarL family sensor kinase
MNKLIFLFFLFLPGPVKIMAYTCTGPFSHDTSEVNKLLLMYDRAYQTDTGKAREYLAKAFTLSRNIKYDKGIALTSAKMGAYYFDRFDIALAEEYYNIALKIYNTNGNKSEEAQIANNLGVISEKRGNYSSSLAFYLNAFEIYDSLKNHKGISVAANNLGIIYYLMNHPQKARRFYLLSLNIKMQTRDTTSLIYTFQNLGNVYLELWQYDSALYCYNQSLELAKAIGDEVSAAKALNSIGAIHLMNGNQEQAIILFNKALSLARKNSDYQNIASLYDNLGMLNYARRKNRLAISYFDSSLVVAEKYGLKEELKTAYQHLSDVYAAEKLYKEAFLNMQSYENLKTDLISERSDAAGVEAVFIKQKQENRILTLEKEREKRKAQLILLGAVVVIIVVTAALLYSINRMHQRSILARTLAEQEKLRFKAVIETQEMERKRIAGDLHDSVGQMLSLSKLHLSEIVEIIPEDLTGQKDTLNDTMRIIDEACQEVRNISHNLMPGTLIRLGLVAAIKDLVRNVNSSKKVKVTFNNEFGEERLDENIEISLFRIIQEVFNNSLKHAQASEMAISLIKKTGNMLQLIITDNGVGFNPEIIKNSSGIGWKNIYSRLAIINGNMNVSSRKKSGTTVDIRVNL